MPEHPSTPKRNAPRSGSMPRTGDGSSGSSGSGTGAAIPDTASAGPDLTAVQNVVYLRVHAVTENLIPGPRGSQWFSAGAFGQAPAIDEGAVRDGDLFLDASDGKVYQAREGNWTPAGAILGPIGPVGLTWQGEWASGQVYATGAGVSRDGSSYVSRVDQNLGNDPEGDDGTRWGTLALRATGDMVTAVWAAGNGAANPHAVDHALYAESAPYSGLINPPALGTAAALSAPGSGNAGNAQVVLGNDSRLGDARSPVPHALSHEAGGSDPLALDQLAAPATTARNVSAAAAGLVPRLPEDPTKFLDGTGSWSAPSGTGTGGAGSGGDMQASVWAAGDIPPSSNPHVVDHAGYANTAPYSGLTGVPASFTPVAHSATHAAGSSDPVTIANTQVAGLGTASTRDVPAGVNASAAQVVLGNDSRLSDARTPLQHATSHEVGGADPIALDQLGTPTTTARNVSTAQAGLVPKLPASATGKALTDSGAFAAVAYSALSGTPTSFVPGPHASTHASGGSDPVTLASSQVTGLGTAAAKDAPASGNAQAGQTVLGSDTRLADARTPVGHAASHVTGGTDVIPAPTSSASGLVPALPATGATTKFLRGDAGFAVPDYNSIGNLPTLGTAAAKDVAASGNASSGQVVTGADTRLGDARNPLAHATTHGSGGSDPVTIANTQVTGLGTASTHDVAASGNASNTQAVLGSDGRLADARTPTAHAATHAAGGSDPLTLTMAQVSDLPVLGTAATKNVAASGNATATQVVSGNDGRLSDARTPTLHGPTHKSGGADAIRLDELAAPTDATTLNVTTSAHGLVPKLINDSTKFFDSTGAWSTPAGTGGGGTGDMQASVYAPGTVPPSSNTHVIDHAAYSDTAPYSGLINPPTLGTASSKDVAASGNASAAQVVLGNDGRLSDGRTPTAHAGTHAANGSDPLTLTTGQISNFPTLGTSSSHDVATSGNATATQVVLGNDGRLTDSRTPLAHESTHITGGSDLIPAPTTSASGLVPPLPASGGTSKFLRGDAGFAQPDYSNLTGTPTLGTSSSHDVAATGNASAGQVVLGNDSRLSDARTPAAHAATHASGGSDPVTLANTQITGLGTASTLNAPASGNATSAQAVIGTDTRLSDARTPTAHAATHLPGGSDAIAVATSTAAGLLPAPPNDALQFLNGAAAFGFLPYTTKTTADFAVPAAGGTVSGVAIVTASWATVGQTWFVSDGTRLGFFEVSQVPSVTQVTLINRGYAGNSTTGTMAAGAFVRLVAPGFATASQPGLLPTPSGSTSQWLRADAVFAAIPYSVLTGLPTLGTAAAKDIPASGNASGSQVVYGTDTRLADARSPLAHATSHVTGGSDPIAAPTTGASGLVPALPATGATSKFLRGDAGFAQPDYSNLTGTPTLGTSASHDVAASGNASASQVVLGNDGRLSDSRTPLAHESTHVTGGSDVIPAPTTSASGLVPVLPATGASAKYLSGTAAFTAVDYNGLVNLPTLGTAAAKDVAASGNASTTQVVLGTDSRLSDARTPLAHAATHKSGGSDSIKLDELAAPTDTTALNVTTSAHGLTPKAPNDGTKYLDGTGSWSTPAGTGGGGTGDMQQSVWAAGTGSSNTHIVDHAAYANAAPYSGLTGVPATFAPAAHATTHVTGGSDVIPAPTTSASGLVPVLPASGATSKFLRGDAGFAQPDYSNLTGTPILGTVAALDVPTAGTNASYAQVVTGSDTRLSDARMPSGHAPTHALGGGDVVLIQRAQVSDLVNNATGVAGLVPAAPGDPNMVYRGNATFGNVPGQWETSASFVWPAVGASVVVSFYATAGLSLGTTLCVLDPANQFVVGEVTAVSAASATLLNRGYAASTGSGTIAAKATAWAAGPGIADAAHPGLLPTPPNDGTKVLLGTGAFGTLTYGSLGSIPATFTPSAHAASHLSGGSDPITLASASVAGLCPAVDNATIQVVSSKLSAVALAYSALTGVPASFTPSAHSSTHKSGGSDAIKLDELAATTDVTTLNASTSAHGLLPKLGGGTTNFFRADGAYAAVAYSSLSGTPTSFTPSAHAATHQSGGSDAIALDTLAATTDVTTLNASTSAHGLLRKLDGTATHYLDGTGAWSAPASGGGTSYLTTTSAFTQPALGGTTTTVVGAVTDLVVGDAVNITDGTRTGQYAITAINSGTLTLTILNNSAGTGMLGGGGSMSAGHLYKGAGVQIDNVSTHFLSGTGAWVAQSGAAQVNLYTTPGNATFTVPAGATAVSVVCIGAGGGGGSGAYEASGTAAGGGGGGGGGSSSYNEILASQLGASVNVTVGGGGAGGASVTSAAAGNNGTAGGASYFGASATANFCYAGGGALGTGGPATTGAAAGGAGGSGTFTGGAGAAGGAALAGSAGVQVSGGAGGGGGGGSLPATQAEKTGGAGADVPQTLGSTGQANAGAVHGAGGAGNAAPSSQYAPGGGGGGGGSSITAATKGGAGGVGGLYGGGGGGGGAAQSTGTTGSGAGGAGATGAVMVITYFASSGGSSGPVKPWKTWVAGLEGIPPASNYATFGVLTANANANRPYLAFNDSATWTAYFMTTVPTGVSLGSGLTTRLKWLSPTGATTGNATWQIAIEKMTTAQNADSFDAAAPTVLVGSSVSATAYALVETAITITTIDSIQAGDGLLLQVQRIGGDGTDSLVGDAGLEFVSIETAA